MKKQEQIKALLMSKQEQDDLDSFRLKNDKSNQCIKKIQNKQVKRMQELANTTKKDFINTKTKKDSINIKENTNKEIKSNKILSLQVNNLTRGQSKKSLYQNNLQYESCRQNQNFTSPFSSQSMRKGQTNLLNSIQKEQSSKLKQLISPFQKAQKKSQNNLTQNSLISGQDKSFSKLTSVSSNDLIKHEVQQKYQAMAMKNMVVNTHNKQKRVSLKEANSVVNRLYQQEQKRQDDLSQLQTTKIVQELSSVRKTPIINKISKVLTRDCKNQLLDETQSFMEKKKENLSTFRSIWKKTQSDIRKGIQNSKNKSNTEEPSRLNYQQTDQTLSASRIEQFTQSQYKWLQKKNEDLSRIRLELEEKQTEVSYSYKPKLCQKSLKILKQKVQVKSQNNFDVDSQKSFYEQLDHNMQNDERNYNFFDDMEENKYHYLRL